MPSLAAIDVSVLDDRISLIFSHRALAAAYAAYLDAEDSRPSYAQAVGGGYRRNAVYDPSSKEVTLAMPPFLTWFITMRQPEDEEDSVTFTFSDADEEQAKAWAESVVLFEPLPCDDEEENGGGGEKQLHVKRLWNREKLLARLEELKKVRGRVTTVCSLKSTRSSPNTRSSPKDGSSSTSSTSGSSSKDGGNSVPWYERQDYGYDGYRYAGVGQTKDLPILAPLPKRVPLALLPQTTTAGLFHGEWW
ncbi:hypothetical protein B0T20DRAFT_487244 [Sordaria brevicollis]|uniref:Uncharacterized protein n=1 Tax=Sordaria brevicollis TaxID=83679 RepID=A0AAE0P9K1_SORBR|nr:hypothetical protein B0T20DRAFT_487244 [Sordaria brevicollis]